MKLDHRRFLGGALACAAVLRRVQLLLNQPAAEHGVALAGNCWSCESEGGPVHGSGLKSDFRECKLGLEQTPIEATQAQSRTTPHQASCELSKTAIQWR